MLENNAEILKSLKLEEISTEEFCELADELLSWCGFGCSGKGGTDN